MLRFPCGRPSSGSTRGTILIISQQGQIRTRRRLDPLPQRLAVRLLLEVMGSCGCCGYSINSSCGQLEGFSLRLQLPPADRRAPTLCSLCGAELWRENWMQIWCR